MESAFWKKKKEEEKNTGIFTFLLLSHPQKRSLKSAILFDRHVCVEAEH